MSVYLLNLFSVPIYALLAHFLPVSRKKKNFTLCLIVGIQLIFAAALRSVNVGGDLGNYISAYKYIGDSPWNELFSKRLEPGYLLLNKILSFFSTHERLLLVVTSVVVVVGFIIYIYRNSKIRWLGLFLFLGLGFYTTSLSMLRQFLAIVVILWSIRYVEKRAFVKFLSTVSIAILFHYTAIVFLILYPISKFKITWRYFWGAMFLAFFFSQFLGKFFLLSVIEKYYDLYEGAMTGGTGYNMLLLLVVITCGGLFVWKSSRQENRQMDIYSHMMIIACCLQFMSLHFGLFARVILYFSVSQLVFIPNVLSCIVNKELRFLSTLILLVLVICYFIVFILGRDMCGILPYRFMWE